MTPTQLNTNLKEGGRKVALSTIPISDNARVALDQMLRNLRSGAIELWQLPFEIRAFYFAGYAEAEQLLQPRVEQAQHEAAIYYQRWRNPGKKLAELTQRQISAAIEEAFARGELNSELDVLITTLEAARPRYFEGVNHEYA